jgi:hypothetical protein
MRIIRNTIKRKIKKKRENNIAIKILLLFNSKNSKITKGEEKTEGDFIKGRRRLCILFQVSHNGL